jgi:hypothetical protein
MAHTTFSGPRHLERAARARLTEAGHFVFSVARPLTFEPIEGEAVLTIDGQHPEAIADLPDPPPAWRHRETCGPMRSSVVRIGGDY